VVEKRFQVFVSSTFQDLQDERQEVMQALLELDCIPSGMELFPAANEDQWTLIKKVIDDCDYYLVIIGGRYGSIGPSGLSYTEMEYRYAAERGKPIIAFAHKDPGALRSDRCDSNPDAKVKLAEFRDLVQGKMVRFWMTPAELGSVVSRSIIRLIRDSPAVGWVRGDALPEEDAAEEIRGLRRRIDQLEGELASVGASAPPGTEQFAQGADAVELVYHPNTSYDRKKPVSSLNTTWNAAFAAVGPWLIVEATQGRIADALEDHIISRLPAPPSGQPTGSRSECAISHESLATVLVQLRALGLITKSTRKHPPSDTASYWTLTPYGDNVLTSLRAIRRDTGGASIA
jgi:hypothetical protein